MSLRKEVKALVEVVKAASATDYGHMRVMDLLSKENQRLREDNRRLILNNNKLMDRLMARNFEAYATYREESEPEEFNPSTGSLYEQTLMDNNVGEVVEDGGSK